MTVIEAVGLCSWGDQLSPPELFCHHPLQETAAQAMKTVGRPGHVQSHQSQFHSLTTKQILHWTSLKIEELSPTLKPTKQYNRINDNDLKSGSV